MSRTPPRAISHRLKTFWDRLSSMAPRAQKKLLEYYSDNIDGSNLEALKEALRDGQNLNMLLDEKLIVRATPKSGCVMFPDIPDHEAWAHWNTPLHHALWLADLEAAEILLKRGADINFYNSIGRTPLHEAVWNERHDVARFLLEKGADINKLTVEKKVRYEDKERDLFGRGGELCLHIALYLSDMEMLRMLLEFGADLSHESQKPWTAFDLALWAGDEEALSLMMGHDGTFLDGGSDGEEISSGGDSTAASRELLAAVSASDDLVPPKHLYGAYRKALHDVAEKDDHSSPESAANLIARFIRALESAAGLTERTKRNSRLCSVCHVFLSQAKQTYNTWKRFTFAFHESRKQLNESAALGCPLCGLAADALDSEDGGLENTSKKKKGKKKAKKDVAIEIFLSENRCWVEWGETDGWIETLDLDESWAETLLKLDGPDETTGSAAAMEIARGWLQRCKDEQDPRHHTCQGTYRRLSNSASLPRRLLYVGDDAKQEHPRVVEGVHDQPYFALSYCWGSTGFFTTTKANLAQNMGGTPLESLPAVMRDAVAVTRALGYQYIWIDALCIIQDDEDDWAREAAGMHAIYSKAELTLSSVTSSDCHTGLFTPRKHRVPHPLPLDVWRPRRLRKAGKAFMAVPEWMQEEPQLHGPVHARAWTLQEQMLSTRVLWFGDGMVYWECLAGCSLEANPTLFASIDDGSGKYHTWKRELERELRIKPVVKGAARSSSNGSEEENSLGEEQRLFQCWQKLLEDFTTRSITKSSDRLPASFAISTTLAGLAGCEHAHGIWLGQRLLQSLCWRVKKQKQGLERSSEMPSWFWAGVGTSILFDLDDSAERGATISPIPCVEIVSLDTRVSTLMNRVSGSLTVKGTLFRKRPLKSLYLKTENPSSVRSFLERADHEKTVFFDEWKDCIDECYAIKLLTFPRGEEYKGMGYPRFPGGKQPNTLHLLLQQVQGQPDAFRRIGIALEPAEHEDLNWEEGEGMIAFGWLVTNEEIYENREIRLV